MGAHDKHRCERCLDRKARFQYRGVVKADRQHTLCFACFRSERDRARSKTLSANPLTRPPAPRPASPLSAAERAHRFRMLGHLTALRRGLPVSTDPSAPVPQDAP